MSCTCFWPRHSPYLNYICSSTNIAAVRTIIWRIFFQDAMSGRDLNLLQPRRRSDALRFEPRSRVWHKLFLVVLETYYLNVFIQRIWENVLNNSLFKNSYGTNFLFRFSNIYMPLSIKNRNSYSHPHTHTIAPTYTPTYTQKINNHCITDSHTHIYTQNPTQKLTHQTKWVIDPGHEWDLYKGS